MVTPAVRREAVAHLQVAYKVSERRACSALGADRASMRYRSRRPDDAAVRGRLRELAAIRLRFGYRRLHVLLRCARVLHSIETASPSAGRTFNPSLTKAALRVPSRWPETLDPEKGASRPEKGASQRMKTDRETAAVALARCSVGSSVGRPLALMETAEAIELFVSCERQLSVVVGQMDNGDIEKTAETVSAFGSSVGDTPSDHRQSQRVLFGAKGEPGS